MNLQMLARMLNINPDVAEGAAALASGAIAEPVAGWAGLTSFAAPSDDPAAQAARVVERVREALTYQPRGAGAQRGLATLGDLVEPYEKGKRWLGDRALDVTGSPGAAAAAYTAPDALLAMLGLRAAGAARGGLPAASGEALSRAAGGPSAQLGSLDPKLAMQNVSRRAAKNTKAEAVGAIDFKSMPPLVRQSEALRDVHLKQMPDGKYVGSPGISSGAQLGSLRRRLYDEMRSIVEKPWVKDYLPWYERQRAGIVEIAGDDPVKQHRAASGTGVYSPQSTPATNYSSMANQMVHHAYTGDPYAFVRTGAQSRNFGRQLAGGRDAKQGPKTGPFAESSDPTRFDPDMATNDIWVGRFLGYDGGSFSRGFTPQEHGFVQGELQRMTAIANRERWGGKSDWHVEEMQALPWVEYKARDLFKKKKVGTYEDGVREAMQTTLEALPRSTIYLNNEVVPGNATRHLSGVTSGSPELKAAYTMEPGNFMDETGRNAFVQSLPNSLEQPAVPFTGNYTNAAGQLESSPGIAFRPAIERQKGLHPSPVSLGVREAFGADNGSSSLPLLVPRKGGSIIDAKPAPVSGLTLGEVLSPAETFISPSSENAMQVMQHLHGGLNAQEASVGSSFFNSLKGRESAADSMLVSRPGHQTTLSDIVQAGRAGSQVGLPDAFHLGDGRTLVTSFDDSSPLPGFGSAKVRERAAQAFPGAEVTLGNRRSIPGAWMSDEWAQPEGSGAVALKMLEAIDKKPGQGAYLLEQFDKNPEVLAQIAAQIERDARYAQMTGTPARADLQRMRSDIVNKFGGLKPFFDYIRKNGAAGYPAAFGWNLWPQEEQ